MLEVLRVCERVENNGGDAYLGEAI